MRTTRALVIAVALAAAMSLGATPVRKTIVLAQGQKVTYSTDYTLLTVEPPEAVKTSTNATIRYAFEQYGQTVLIEGRKIGYGKLLLEKADSNIGGVLNVIVVDKATYDGYQRILAELSGVDGISADTILVTNKRILIGGSVYSKPDLDRCVGLEKSISRPSVTCAARLSSAVNVVFPAEQYDVRTSVSVRETADKVQGEQDRGMEGESLWTLTVRLGDIPVFALESRDPASFVPRVAAFCDKIDRLVREWTVQTERKKVPFPATFHADQTRTGYELRGQWSFNQGSKGAELITLRPEDVTSYGVPGRVMNWWAAILQDAFHLYFLAERPSRTLSATSPMPLVTLYENAVKIEPTFSRANSRSALSRSFFSLMSSTGQDPFEHLLEQVPTDFKESSN